MARIQAAVPVPASAHGSGTRRIATSTKAATPTAAVSGIPSGFFRSAAASLMAVPAMRPADAAPIPRTAPATAGWPAQCV